MLDVPSSWDSSESPFRVHQSMERPQDSAFKYFRQGKRRFAFDQYSIFDFSQVPQVQSAYSFPSLNMSNLVRPGSSPTHPGRLDAGLLGSRQKSSTFYAHNVLTTAAEAHSCRRGAKKGKADCRLSDLNKKHLYL